MILKNILRLAVLLLLSASLLFNALTIGGCFGRDALVREKDRVIERFTERVRELEEMNRHLKNGRDLLEVRLAEFSTVHAWAKKEIDRIWADFRKLNEGAAP